MIKTPIRPALALGALVAALAGLTIIGLWRVLHGLCILLPGDPNEGWNAYHTASLMNGHGLYPAKDAYLVNNYPPLSFYVVAAVSWLTGDVIFAGRIISLLSVGAIGVAMGAILRHWGASWRIALFPALWFASVLMIFSDYVGMDDPQLLAHAVAMGALWVLITKPQTAKFLALSAALFVISIFIKHNIVALPAGCGLWLLWAARGKGLQFSGFGIAFALLGLMAFRLIYGFSLLSAVSTARLYSLSQLIDMTRTWAIWGGFALLGLGVLATCHWRRLEAQFLLIFAGLSLGLGISFLGGAGVDVNAMFEADIALGLAGGLLIALSSGWYRVAAAALYVLPLVVFVCRDEDWQHAYLQAHPLAAEQAMAAKDIAFMQAQKGPALCELLSFCYWAQKPVAVDFFNVGQAFDTHTRSDAEITAKIEAKYYAVIQLDPGSQYPLGENVQNAMDRAYRRHHEDWFGTFYVPK